MRKKDEDQYSYISLEALTTPTDHYTCRLNMWWLVEPSRGVLVFRPSNTYQCNSSKQVLEHIRDDRLLDIVFIPMAFLPPTNHW